MKIAVIGTGYWGKNHVREYCQQGHEIIACDLKHENLEFCRQNFPIKYATTSLDEILSDKSIQSASICVPNQFHFEIAKKCLSAGKHVLLEKPMCLSSEDCKKLVVLARKKKLVLNIGHVFRFNNAVKKLREMVKQNELGKVYLAKLVWTNIEPIFPDRDILFDLAPHPFDIVNFVFEKNPEQVSAIGKEFRKHKGEEAAFVNAMLDGILVNLEISWVTPEKKRTITVVGSRKSVFVDALSQKMEAYDVETKQRAEIPIAPSNSLGDELRHFTECVEKNIDSTADGKVGYEIIYIIERALESLRKKKVLKV